MLCTCTCTKFWQFQALFDIIRLFHLSMCMLIGSVWAYFQPLCWATSWESVYWQESWLYINLILIFLFSVSCSGCGAALWVPSCFWWSKDGQGLWEKYLLSLKNMHAQHTLKILHFGLRPCFLLSVHVHVDNHLNILILSYFGLKIKKKKLQL